MDWRESDPRLVRYGHRVMPVAEARARGGNGDAPGPTPSKLARLLERIHEAHRTERAIAATAAGRRIKAQQARKEGRP